MFNFTIHFSPLPVLSLPTAILNISTDMRILQTVHSFSLSLPFPCWLCLHVASQPHTHSTLYLTHCTCTPTYRYLSAPSLCLPHPCVHCTLYSLHPYPYPPHPKPVLYLLHPIPTPMHTYIIICLPPYLCHPCVHPALYSLRPYP